MRTAPTIGRILSRDWVALGMLLMPGFCWAFWLFIMLVPMKDDPEAGSLRGIFSVMGGVITLVCGTIIFLRIRRVRRTFARGAQVMGSIVQVIENSEDIESVVIAYTFCGQDHTTRNVTESVWGRFKVGDEVELVVDPDKPSRAYLVAMYETLPTPAPSAAEGGGGSDDP